jgi:serine/threonine-protein kinase
LKSRRDAGRREALARHFTEAIARIDATARYSALAPLHDIRPDLQDMRTEMARIAADMKSAGSIANGPGHYALGRGYWTLGDLAQAREHLQLGWDAGYREPRAAYALAVVLGRQYQEQFLEAERIRQGPARSPAQDHRHHPARTRPEDAAPGPGLGRPIPGLPGGPPGLL